MNTQNICQTNSMTGYLVLVLLAAAQGLRIITRSMIRTPEDAPRALEYQLIPLKSPVSQLTGRALEEPDVTSTPEPEETSTESRQFTEQPEEFDSAEEINVKKVISPYEIIGLEQSTTIQAYRNSSITSSNETFNTTNSSTPEEEKDSSLIPLARLWPEETKSEPDIWSLLRTAYMCVFSGLDCFSDRVLPMVKSYLGLDEDRPNKYMLPRNSEVEREEEGEVEPRIFRHRFLKELLIGLLLANTALLPFIGGVGLASGKALLTSLLSLGAAGAVAAIPQQPNYYM